MLKSDLVALFSHCKVWMVTLDYWGCNYYKYVCNIYVIFYTLWSYEHC